MSSRRQPTIRDLWARLTLSPIFGIAIPNLSGLIDHSRHTRAALVVSYLFFTLTALVIWEGNRQLYFRFPQRDEWLRHPLRRMMLLMGMILLYTIPVSAGLLWIWRQATGDPGTRAFAIPTAVLATVAVVAIITHAYETVFLLHDWESDRLRSARLERERLLAELAALEREVDPHFLFNNLNALVHLVEQGSERAVPFIDALSGAYRYVLNARGRPLVPLAEELEALRRHHLLANIRYRGAIVLSVDVPAEVARSLGLPPVTLPELLQNAMKHNQLSPDNPLLVDIRLDGTTLVASNELRPPAGGAAVPSTGVGLANLAERIRLATGHHVEWRTTDGRFELRLPLVPIAPHPDP
jgi:Histidine kinase